MPRRCCSPRNALGIHAAADADGRRLGQRRGGGARGRLSGGRRAVRLQRRRAGARRSGRWYSRFARGRRADRASSCARTLRHDSRLAHPFSPPTRARVPLARGRLARLAPSPPPFARAARTPLQQRRLRKSAGPGREHAHGSRIPRARRARLQPHPARPRVVRRPRHAAVAVPEARQPALHVPARIGRRGRALRPLLVHRPAARGAAARVGRSRRSRGRDGRRSSVTRAIRSRSSRSYLRRFRAAPRPGCRDSAAVSLAISATTPCAHIETKLHGHAPTGAGGLDDVPDMLLLLTDELAVIDNLAGRIYLIVYADPSAARRVRARRRIACTNCDASCASRRRFRSRRRRAHDAGRTANSAPTAYMAAVRRAKEYIAAGDIMQVVLSQRMSRAVHCVAAVALSRAAFAQPVAVHVLLRLRRLPRGRGVARDPRAQGRRDGDVAPDRGNASARGNPRTSTQRYGEELLGDPKEIAEHVMLLDLGRNDVGRVAAIGTVRVTEQMAIERYSHVMHIVSNVEGTLKPGLTSFDVLAASFPAGTVSGAPKVRAMEIIDELEPTRRGVYAGAVGYVSFQDDMDTRDRDSNRSGEGRRRLRPGRRGHRARFGARDRMAGNAEQGESGPARGRAGANGPRRGALKHRERVRERPTRPGNITWPRSNYAFAAAACRAVAPDFTALRSIRRVARTVLSHAHGRGWISHGQVSASRDRAQFPA